MDPVWRIRGSAVALVGALLGCSEGPSPSHDAGAGTLDAGSPLDIAELPWLASGEPMVSAPVLTPCPTGWREVTSSAGDPTTCDPYPDGGELECPMGQAHFAGEPGCASIGTACPKGDWPEALPATGVVYVQLGAPAGGDGTLAQPFARIRDALAVATRGQTIALAKGHYDETVVTRSAVRIVGACAEATWIAPSVVGMSSGAFVATGTGLVQVSNLSIVGFGYQGVTVDTPGLELELDGVDVASNVIAGLRVGRGARLTARSIVVRDTRPSATGLGGVAINVDGGGHVGLTRAVLANNRTVAAYATDEGTTLTLTRVVLRDTEPQASDLSRGQGLTVQAGAHATLTEVLFERNRDIAIQADGAGSTIDGSDVVARDTRSRQSDGGFGRALDVEHDASVTLRRVLFERSHDSAIFAQLGGTIALEDVVVRDTTGQESDQDGGLAVEIQRSAHFTARRIVLARQRGVGAQANGNATLDLEDAVIRDTESLESSGDHGGGLVFIAGSTGTLRRTIVERAREFAILVDGEGSHVQLEDFLGRDIESDTMASEMGRGIDVQAGAIVEGDRVLVDRTREMAMFVTGGSSAILEHAVFRDVRTAACAGTSCGELALGVAAYDTGQITLTHFAIDGAALCGVHVARSGAIDLHVGVVRGSQIGACIGADGYDTARLGDRVAYVDNGTPLSARTLPVPSAGLPFDDAR